MVPDTIDPCPDLPEASEIFVGVPAAVQMLCILQNGFLIPRGVLHPWVIW